MQVEHPEEPALEAEQPRCVQYLFLRLDPAWRRLPEDVRTRGKRDFARVIEQAAGINTFAYSTLGLKAGSDLMLWRVAGALDVLQDSLAVLLRTGLGQYLEISHVLFGLTRPSTYTKRRTPQEQAIDENERLRYFTVYPFSKTVEWYLMSREARQGMMNEHMRVGHEYSQVRQVLLYASGLDDQEFVVAYETDDLPAYQALVMALRSVEARRYTLKDQPVFTAIYRPLNEALDMLG